MDAQVSVKRTIGKIITAFKNTPSSKVKSVNLSGLKQVDPAWYENLYRK